MKSRFQVVVNKGLLCDLSHSSCSGVGEMMYRKNSDISPKFEMDLAPCRRASALRVSVMSAIERRLIIVGEILNQGKRTLSPIFF